MEAFLASVQFWHWLILAAVLGGIEALLPGMFFIWFGLAAAATGAIVFLIPGLGWEWEAVLFVVLAVASVLVGRARHASRRQGERGSRP